MHNYSEKLSVIKSKLGLEIPVPEGVTLRRGRESDLPSITRLSVDVDFLMGGDYMPGLWLTWLNDPMWSLFVAEKDGQVVSTSCYRTVHGGTTAAGVGGKTHPSIRAGGAFKALKWYTGAEVNFEYPKMSCVYGVTSFIDFVKEQQSSQENGTMWNFKDVGRRMQWLMKESLEDILQATSILKTLIRGVRCIQPMTTEKLKPFLKDRQSLSYLFPSGHFNMGPEAYEAHADTAYLMCESYRKTFITKTGDQATSLSIGSTFSCPVGTAYYIDYYGNIESDAILQHLLQHLMEIPEQHRKYGGQVFIMLGLPIDCDMEYMKDTFTKKLLLSKNENKVQEIMLQAFKFALQSRL